MSTQNDEAAVSVHDVAFYSEGKRLDAHLYVPSGISPGERRGAMICLAGFTATSGFRSMMDDPCRRLAADGYVTFAFDHRGFGASEGTRMPHPFMQATDIRNAITYLQTRGEVDPFRIGLFGISMGGALATYVAGIDDRAAAVVSIFGLGDARRWLHGLRNHNDWEALLRRVHDNRVQRVLTGVSDTIDTYELMPRSEPVDEMHRRELAQGVVGGSMPLETVEALLQFRPEDVVDRISPRPVLYVHSAIDKQVPVEEAIRLFDRTGEPRTLWLLPARYFQRSHYEVFEGMGDLTVDGKWSTICRHAADWLTDALPPVAEMSYRLPSLNAGWASSMLDEAVWLRRESIDRGQASASGPDPLENSSNPG